LDTVSYAARSTPPICGAIASNSRRPGVKHLALLSDAFGKRLERLTRTQQKELKNLLEQIL